LLDDVKADKKLLDTFRDSCQNVQPHALNPLAAEISNRPQTATERWQRMVSAAGQKLEELGGDLAERKTFWEDWKTMETWLKDSTWKAGTAQEMYTEGIEKTKRDLEVESVNTSRYI
jgi:hypothetical protein